MSCQQAEKQGKKAGKDLTFLYLEASEPCLSNLVGPLWCKSARKYMLISRLEQRSPVKLFPGVHLTS